MARYIMRKCGDCWRIWDRDNGVWHGKKHADSAVILARLNRINSRKKEKSK